MQNRIDPLFKQIARDSEYFDRGAAVFVAKHQRKSVSRRKRTVWMHEDKLCSNFKNKIRTFIPEVK